MKNNTTLTQNHWIFDMDGTLTIAVHDFDAIRTELDLPAGRPILESLAALPPDEAGALHKRLNEIELKLSRKARPARGARSLLEVLRDRGAQPGILTRNNRENVRVTLVAAGLSEFFDEEWIVTRDDAPPKPDPAGLRHLMDRWATPPADVLMIGDYLFDLQAGRAAGAATVYVDPAGEFMYGEHADHKIRGLDELLV